MNVRIAEDVAVSLADYARVPIAFEVRSIVDIDVQPDGRMRAERECPVATPWIKDYDSIPGNHPTDWAARFDLSRWGFFSAWMDARRVGGAAVAVRMRTADMLVDRDDFAVLWDIRVAPALRGAGVGSALLDAAERWVRGRGGVHLMVETQDINAIACRFYHRHGFLLERVNRGAYAEFPEEAQLLWYKDLDSSGIAGKR